MPNVFLYGPDTFRKRTFERIGACTVLGSARLDGYALNFNKPNMKNEKEGFANLTPEPGETIYGVVFELDEAQTEMLAGYFGGYQSEVVKVQVRKLDQEVEATIYIARRSGRGLKPSQAVLDDAIRGAEENGLPKDFLEKLQALVAI